MNNPEDGVIDARDVVQVDVFGHEVAETRRVLYRGADSILARTWNRSRASISERWGSWTETEVD